MTKFVKGSSKTTPLVKKNASKKPSMVVSDEILPELCKRIGVNGTSSKHKLIKEFVNDFPNTSVRQATIKFSEIVTSIISQWVSPPEGKKPSYHVYLKPSYYNLLPENERPNGWRKVQDTIEKKSCSTPTKKIKKTPTKKTPNSNRENKKASLLTPKRKIFHSIDVESSKKSKTEK